MTEKTKARANHAALMIRDGVSVTTACKRAHLALPTWYAYKRKLAQSEAGASQAINGEAVQKPTVHNQSIGLALLTSFEEAARADEMKGGGDPESIPQTERYYRLQRNLMIAYIDTMEAE